MAMQRSVVHTCLAVGLLLPCVLVADGPPGELWQVSSKVSMEGVPFNMPAQTVKVCTKSDAQEPPGAANPERGCTSKDMKRVGNVVTFTSVCAGPPPMSGPGKITFEGDGSYVGTIVYAGPDGKMTIELKGRKLGDCENPR